MQDLPPVDDLLAAVAGYLREQASPQLRGQAAFHARVAANVVEIVRRQLALAPAAEAAEAERLRALLGAQGSLAELNKLLCRRIAGGEMNPNTPGLVSHLWRVTLDKLAVDQPAYESLRRVRAAGPAPPDKDA